LYYVCNYNSNYDLLIYSTYRGNCSFRKFAPAPIIQPYYCFQSGIVSSCPAYFHDWKLNRDCEKSPSAWVYHTNGVYRNAFCAICNLGDDILSAQVEGVPGKGLLQSNYTYRILDIIYDYEWDRPITISNTLTTVVRLNANTRECCISTTCYNITYLSTWGTIPTRDAYLWLPFNTSYTDESSLHHAFTESVDISTLCLGIGDPFRIPIGAAVEGQVNFSLHTILPESHSKFTRPLNHDVKVESTPR